MLMAIDMEELFDSLSKSESGASCAETTPPSLSLETSMVHGESWKHGFMNHGITEDLQQLKMSYR